MPTVRADAARQSDEVPSNVICIKQPNSDVLVLTYSYPGRSLNSPNG